jgi:putative transposase
LASQVESSEEIRWPYFGVPRLIYADNAKEFRGETLKLACRLHHMDLQWRPVKKPKWGAHVERMLGTLSEHLKRMDGATFSNPQERGNYDSEKNATMTLHELERYLAIYIDGVYHNTVHSALGMTPREAWRYSLIGGSKKLKAVGAPHIPEDEIRLKLDLLPFFERQILPYGIRFNNIHYLESFMRKHIGEPDPKHRRLKRRFLFRYDPTNLSIVYMWDEKNTRYLPVNYRDRSRPAVSLWEVKEAQRIAKKNKKKIRSEAHLFAAIRELRKIQATSKSETKKARRENQRRKNAKGAHERKPADMKADEQINNGKPTEKKRFKPFSGAERR